MKYAGLLLLIALIFNPLLGATIQAQTPNPANLPLLAEGTHFGITYPYSEISNEPEIAAKVSEAAAEGVNGFTFYAEWGVLEPEPGVYDLTSLETTLIWLNSQQIQSMLNLSVINIDWLTLPPDLLNADGTDLADGLSFDHPDVQARLFALLDEVVPLLVANGGFLITLGNELDSWFNGSPAASPEDLTAYAALVAAARDHIHTIEPELAVWVTLTGGEAMNQGTVFQALMPVTDTLPFNFYPLSELLTVQHPEGIAAALEAHLQVYGDKPIVIQELGCPSDTSMESSLDYQHECFEVMFETLEAYPQVRYVSVFTLFDWDEPTCDEIVSFFSDPDEEIPPVILARWRGFHCTLGLLNPDLTPKPAWEALLTAAK
jgi:hypothetical protein